MDLNIAILDDHPPIIEFVEAKLTEKGFVKQFFGISKEEALLTLLGTKKIDILILDLDLHQQKDGLVILKEVKKKFPTLKVLIYTYRSQEAVCYAVREAEADGLVTKSEDTTELLRAIAYICEGKSYFSPEVQQFFIRRPQRNYIPPTAIELEVLKKLAAGLKQPEIAKEMKKSVETIENYMRSLRNRFSVLTTPQLIAEAFRQGFLV
jgi:two-component system invasion response regulator UvrY